MFGVDLSELMVILVVALVVVGPERLPAVARTFGHLWGRLQRYVNNVKADISREMAIEEFRQLQQKINRDVMSFEREANQAVQAVGEQMQPLDGAAQPPAKPAVQDDSAARQAQPDPAPEQKNPEPR
ncbi:MAG: twin-arginine translocase subunit TatB [Nitrosomonadales bacterium]|nr:twin-arginine translocase subunit TatB [Nitrosomonadales bacterium]